jgi:hypothetical protein
MGMKDGEIRSCDHHLKPSRAEISSSKSYLLPLSFYFLCSFSFAAIKWKLTQLALSYQFMLFIGLSQGALREDCSSMAMSLRSLRCRCWRDRICSVNPCSNLDADRNRISNKSISPDDLANSTLNLGFYSRFTIHDSRGSKFRRSGIKFKLLMLIELFISLKSHS